MYIFFLLSLRAKFYKLINTDLYNIKSAKDFIYYLNKYSINKLFIKQKILDLNNDIFFFNGFKVFIENLNTFYYLISLTAQFVKI